mmetsp:Transcript_23874/g.70834  ORF Transcript_23874/g.70834 Transcript_23874/m.70834 type:complete len:282 (+) Transcript_23874:364-1209(+)|eukprot:362749-Chlamydomonas_euryale.AAC.2
MGARPDVGATVGVGAAGKCCCVGTTSSLAPPVPPVLPVLQRAATSLAVCLAVRPPPKSTRAPAAAPASPLASVVTAEVSALHAPGCAAACASISAASASANAKMSSAVISTSAQQPPLASAAPAALESARWASPPHGARPPVSTARPLPSAPPPPPPPPSLRSPPHAGPTAHAAVLARPTAHAAVCAAGIPGGTPPGIRGATEGSTSVWHGAASLSRVRPSATFLAPSAAAGPWQPGAGPLMQAPARLGGNRCASSALTSTCARGTGPSLPSGGCGVNPKL